MLYDENPERSLFLRMTLERLGHQVVAERGQIRPARADENKSEQEVTV